MGSYIPQGAYDAFAVWISLSRRSWGKLQVLRQHEEEPTQEPGAHARLAGLNQL